MSGTLLLALALPSQLVNCRHLAVQGSLEAPFQREVRRGAVQAVRADTLRVTGGAGQGSSDSQGSALLSPERFSVAPQVSETERLCYVGHNFGSEAMKCNSLCRYGTGSCSRTELLLPSFRAGAPAVGARLVGAVMCKSQNGLETACGVWGEHMD